MNAVGDFFTGIWNAITGSSDKKSDIDSPSDNPANDNIADEIRDKWIASNPSEREVGIPHQKSMWSKEIEYGQPAMEAFRNRLLYEAGILGTDIAGLSIEQLDSIYQQELFDYISGISIDVGAGLSINARPPSVNSKVIPRGFTDSNQYNKAMKELQSIVGETGATDARLGISGSSVTGYKYTTGAPFGPASDIDVFVESNTLTQGLRSSSTIPGFVKPEVFMSENSAISSWAQKWSNILGREVSVGGFPAGGLPERPTIFFGGQ